MCDKLVILSSFSHTSLKTEERIKRDISSKTGFYILKIIQYLQYLKYFLLANFLLEIHSERYDLQTRV